MANWYVNPSTGSDTYNGTSATFTSGTTGPKLTLAAGEALLAAGDTLNLAAGTFTLTSTVSVITSGTVAGGPITWLGAGSSSTIITSSTSGLDLIKPDNVYGRHFKGIQFTHTGSTRGNAFLNGSDANFDGLIDGCLFDGCLSAVFAASAYNATWNLNFINNEVRNSTGTGGVFLDAGSVVDCYIHNNVNSGVAIAGTRTSLTVARNLIVNNGGRGIFKIQYGSVCGLILSNTIAGNTSDGIGTDTTQAVHSSFAILGNLIHGNGGYGLNLVSGEGILVSSGANGFGSNTSGPYGGVAAAGTGDVTGIAAPFTNSAAGDYSLNGAAGSGALCRAAGSPNAFPAGLSAGYLDIGAVQHADSGSVAAATTYAVNGPTSGYTSEALNYSVAPNGAYTGTVTPSDGAAGGTFSPTSLTWSASSTMQGFTYTQATARSVTLSFASSPSLTNPGNIALTVSAPTSLTLAQVQGELDTRGLTAGFTAGTSGGVNVNKFAGHAVVLDANFYPGVNVVDVAGSAASAVSGAISANVTQVGGQAASAAAPVAFPASIASSGASVTLASTQSFNNTGQVNLPGMASGAIVAGSTVSAVVVSGLPAGKSFVGQHLYYPGNGGGEARTIGAQSYSSPNYTFTFSGSAGTEAGPFSSVNTGDLVCPSP